MDGAFRNERNLSSVILYENIIEGSLIFDHCRLDVFYTGTSIDKAKYDAIRFNASITVYCYAEVMPQEEGNFWHYDTDGVTPVIW